MISTSKKIGEGVYGEVFKSINSSNESVAIKVGRFVCYVLCLLEGWCKQFQLMYNW